MRAVVAIFEQLVPISGGGTPRTWHVVRSLVHRGHEVYVAASYGTAPDAAQRELGCAGVVALPHVSRLDRHKLWKYLVVYPANMVRLALYIGRIKPDVVISHNTAAGFGALVGRRLSRGTTTILDLTDLLFEYLESYSRRWMQPVLAVGRALERQAIRGSDRIVTISRAMRQILVDRYEVCESKVDIVHDGVDCSLFRPGDGAAVRQQVSPWTEHVCVLHGVIDPQDGPEVLVLAAPNVLSRFPKTAFWWIGDGGALPQLRTLAQRLGLREHMFFSGWVNQSQVVDYIQASDLGVVALPDILSARGRVTLKEFEYWACGRAAVLPRLPALQEIVPEGVASLFYQPGDPADLADKICVLLADDILRQQLGRSGREMVERSFDWQVLADRFAQFCEGYVGETASGRRARVQAGGTE